MNSVVDPYHFDLDPVRDPTKNLRKYQLFLQSKI